LPRSTQRRTSRCKHGARSLSPVSFVNYASLKNTFNATDRVADYYVFDIGGNKYRIIAAIH
jgi:mRNA interferase HigB